MSDDVLLIDVLVPVRLVSEPNERGHWGKKARRMKVHRRTAFLMMRAVDSWQVPNPNREYRVHITRIAPRKLDDDNNIAAAKGVRDGIADALAIDDGSTRIRWDYSQERGEPNTYAARVQIWRLSDGT